MISCDDSDFPEKRIVAVFLEKDQAVAAANSLWAHIKLRTAPTFTYQEIREDAINGNFQRRLESSGRYEHRQISVEAPAPFEPIGQDFDECTSTPIEFPQKVSPQAHHRQNGFEGQRPRFNNSYVHPT